MTEKTVRFNMMCRENNNPTVVAVYEVIPPDVSHSD